MKIFLVKICDSNFYCGAPIVIFIRFLSLGLTGCGRWTPPTARCSGWCPPTGDILKCTPIVIFLKFADVGVRAGALQPGIHQHLLSLILLARFPLLAQDEGLVCSLLVGDCSAHSRLHEHQQGRDFLKTIHQLDKQVPKRISPFQRSPMGKDRKDNFVSTIYEKILRRHDLFDAVG